LRRESFSRGDSMRPREVQDSGQNDLFRSRLDQIIDLKHPLVKLAHAPDWQFLQCTLETSIATGPVNRRYRPASWQDWRSSHTISATRRCANAGWRTHTSNIDR